MKSSATHKEDTINISACFCTIVEIKDLSQKESLRGKAMNDLAVQ